MSAVNILSLWGMPGAGKSYWGRKLADALSLDFIDLDEFVEKESGERIFEMVNQKGEPYFRAMEEKVLNKLLDGKQPLILSLGGGTPCAKNNFNRLKEKSFSIWLNTKIELSLKTWEKKVVERPLIDPKSDMRVQMENLLAKRKEHYKKG